MKASTTNTADEVDKCQEEIGLSRIEARIEEIRAEIEAGTYLTPERIGGAVERILKILGSVGMPFHQLQITERCSSQERDTAGTKDVRSNSGRSDARLGAYRNNHAES
jgi:hypothetical protein